MQLDFHYYATAAAALIAGYDPDQSIKTGFFSQMTDHCSRTFLSGIKAPLNAATTQLMLELMESGSDPVSMQDITRIWASFHFLPADLKAQVKGSILYKSKYRLICGPDGELAGETVRLAKREGTIEAAGLAMHVLADTWAHRYFAGTPSLVINNIGDDLEELIPGEEGFTRRPVKFRHSLTAEDDPENGIYNNSLNNYSEKSVMVLGHGRAGHLPDLSFARYVYMPAWGDYKQVIKDNPKEYYNAFCQMVYALKYLRGEVGEFETGVYDYEAAEPYGPRIKEILEKRQLDACGDWKAFLKENWDVVPGDFDTHAAEKEYTDAPDSKKDDTAIGRFVLAALAQKSMVSGRIFRSGNLLAGFSADPDKGKGIKDFMKLKDYLGRRGTDD